MTALTDTLALQTANSGLWSLMLSNPGLAPNVTAAAQNKYEIDFKSGQILHQSRPDGPRCDCFPIKSLTFPEIIGEQS